jgi:hypothetical protein
MLLDTANAECPRDLPKTQTVKGAPTVGLSNLFGISPKPEQIFVCFCRDEGTVTTSSATHAQSSINDQDFDSTFFALDHVPHSVERVYGIAPQPKGNGRRLVALGEIPDSWITWRVSESESGSERAHGRRASDIKQLDRSEDQRDQHQGWNESSEVHPMQYRSIPQKSGFRKLQSFTPN